MFDDGKYSDSYVARRLNSVDLAMGELEGVVDSGVMVDCVERSVGKNKGTHLGVAFIRKGLEEGKTLYIPSLDIEIKPLKKD